MFRRLLSTAVNRLINVESTPNPRTFLFTATFDSFKFRTPLQFERSLASVDNSTAQSILDLPGVERVLMFSPNSAAVTVVSEAFADPDFQDNVKRLLSEASGEFIKDEVTDASIEDQSVAKAIQEVLDFRVRPAVQSDGGDVEFVSYDQKSKTVTLKMRGACLGCPSSEQTLRGGITQTLRFYLPNDVEQVVCEEAEIEPEVGGVLKHVHHGEPIPEWDKKSIKEEIPWVSLFAAKPDDKMKDRIGFFSEIEIPKKRISPDLVVNIKCEQCGAHRAIEALDSLLLNQPQKKDAAAVVICPACAVVFRAK